MSASALPTNSQSKTMTQASLNAAIKKIMAAKVDKAKELAKVKEPSRTLSSGKNFSNEFRTVSAITKSIGNVKKIQEHSNQIVQSAILLEYEKDNWEPGSANIIFYQYAGAIAPITSCLLFIKTLRYETNEELKERQEKISYYQSGSSSNSEADAAEMKKLTRRIYATFKGLEERYLASGLTPELMHAAKLKTEFPLPQFWEPLLSTLIGGECTIEHLNAVDGVDVAIFIKKFSVEEKRSDRRSANGQIFPSLTKYVSVNGFLVKGAFRADCEKSLLKVLDPFNLACPTTATSSATTTTSEVVSTPTATGNRKRKTPPPPNLSFQPPPAPKIARVKKLSSEDEVDEDLGGLNEAILNEFDSDMNDVFSL